MRFEIEAYPQGGLKVIPLIPDVGPICEIEGRNGIGKSVALRLLQLCSGNQPYGNDPDSWATLREQLGPTVVRAIGLRDGETVVWRLNPEVWKETPEPVGAWLGTVEIDGAQARLEDAQRLIQVVHHSGDLTLEGTIRARIARDRSEVGVIRRRFGDREQGIGLHLDALRRDLERADYHQLSALAARADEARARAAEEAVAVENARAGRAAVERAMELREQQRRLREDVPELEARERGLDQEIAEAGAELRRVEQRYNELRAQRRRDEAVVTQIEEVEKAISGRARRAEAARERAAQSAAVLGLSDDRQVVERELARLRAERDELVRERDLIDATPRVRQLVDDLSTRLDTQRAHDLDEQVIAVLADEAVTVRELRGGVKARREELGEYEPEPTSATLAARIQSLTTRAARLSTLVELMTKASRAQELVAESQAQLAELTAQLPAEEAAEFQQIEQALSAARARHLSLVESRAVVRGKITEIVGGGAEEGARELEQLLGALGSDENSLEEVLAARAAELETRLREQALASVALTEAQRQLQLARAEFEQAVAILEGGDDYGWLRSDGIELPSSDLSEEENGERLTRLRSVVAELERRFDGARETLRALDGALDAWASPDRAGERMTPTGESVRRHYERVFGTELSSQDIVKAIFDAGEFVALDLASMVVSWRTEDGELRTRPLAAFSSGERAFAYTRTRLQAIGSQARNTVVALDEFGAFLARDRLKQLVSFLEHDVLGTIANEVIIVLPLIRDYEAELDETTGGLHQELAERVAELRSNGYFARPPDWLVV